jgi:mRNA interferase RelE/StbE
MAEYTITFARSARKELVRLHDPLSSRIITRIEALASVPRPVGCRKLEGGEDLWRIRIGDYRVVYSIKDRTKEVDIVGVRHRSEAYR